MFSPVKQNDLFDKLSPVEINTSFFLNNDPHTSQPSPEATSFLVERI